MDEKIAVIKKVFEDVDVTGTADILDEIIKRWAGEQDKAYFEYCKSTERVSEAILLMNPKHKDQMRDFLYVSGLKVPVVYGKFVEEDKAYMITDKKLAKNLREAYDYQRLK